MWLTEKLCVLHSLALGVYFYSSALMWLKTTASQISSVFTCWMSRLCLCFYQTVEVCKAARRGQSCHSQGEQQPSSASPAIVAHFSQSETSSSYPTNRTPFDLPSTGGRSHLGNMQITFQWGPDLTQSYFPAGDFSIDGFSFPQIFIQCQETLMISHNSSLCVCVCVW